MPAPPPTPRPLWALGEAYETLSQVSRARARARALLLGSNLCYSRSSLRRVGSMVLSYRAPARTVGTCVSTPSAANICGELGARLCARPWRESRSQNRGSCPPGDWPSVERPQSCGESTEKGPLCPLCPAPGGGNALQVPLRATPYPEPPCASQGS